jgi:hypothetical protein
VKVVRYGVGREVELTTRDGDWTDLEDGRRLWIAELTSPEAIGLRVHFRDVLLPAGARLAIYAADLRGFDAAKNPVEIHGGPLGDDRRHDFWTGSMPGERSAHRVPGDKGERRSRAAATRCRSRWIASSTSIAIPCRW